MPSLKAFCATLAIAFLAGCGGMSSTLVTQKRLEADLAGKLDFDKVEAATAIRRFTQADLDQLKEAVRTRAPRPAGGGVPVTVRLTVTDYTPGAARMTVAVRVVDGSGKVYAEFEVHQTANAVLGVVYDQRTAVIDAVADRIGQALMTMPVAPAERIDARNYGT
ncbi:MAG: hypothetical protein U1F41_16365 [Burkholderiales bacterium]